LANTVAYAIKDQPNWEKLRLAGRQYVEGERNWSASVNRYKAVYEKCNSRI
jgi:glycosyltransferase involved in cell wall biosynthesis